jgi:hypothetical protein
MSIGTCSPRWSQEGCEVRMGREADQKSRCVHCRTDVLVPASYADGDHIKCGACGTGHRVVRSNNIVRLVVADVAPLRETLRQNDQRLRILEADLRDARASLGIGINGLLIGLLYVVVKVAWDEEQITRGLIITAVVIASIVGILLELANFFLLAKRTKMTRLGEEIAQLNQDSRELRRQIREASMPGRPPG